MWKATATLGNDTVPRSANAPANNDDEWDSDPNFVNDISEKDQRWGKQKTIEDDKPLIDTMNMAEFRQKVISSNNDTVVKLDKVAKDWQEKAKSVKNSYGAGK